MCTLTFIPGLPGGGYLLAMNRDESPRRAVAVPPAVQRFGARPVIAPRDPDGGGTWIGVDDGGRCVAILNGDRPAPAGASAVGEPALGTEVVSRGLLVHDLLEDPRPRAVRDELERRRRLDALRYRPFKLVIAAPGSGSGGEESSARILRIDWNGRDLSFQELGDPQIVVSSGFETEAVTSFRRAAFERFLVQQAGAIEQARGGGGGGGGGSGGGSGGAPALERLAGALEDFHASHHPQAPQGDARSVCKHREEAHTVSSTLVVVSAEEVSVRYRAGWPCQRPQSATTTMRRTS